MKKILNSNWKILQDVHDTVEKVGIKSILENNVIAGNLISEWEELPELKHLQLIFSENPYFGRELRYFNNAPWWYRNEFIADANDKYIRLTFTNVDYYCKVYLNDRFIGEHEGYTDRFSFDIEDYIKPGEKNIILVKVWSPWDEQVEGNKHNMRVYLVERNMVKGTYEHADGLLQRDVNPVGIYGQVYLECFDKPFFDSSTEISYELDAEKKEAFIKVLPIVVHGEKELFYRLRCYDCQTKEVVYDSSFEQGIHRDIIKQIKLWNTWDRGEANLYKFVLELISEGQVVDIYQCTTGFRKVEMIRTENETSMILNGKKIYIRGTSYFPDQYISAMNSERYQRDLLQIKQAGFNLVRVHVHIEMQEFYDLCDRYGIAVMQDSEYNWMHPFEGDFAKRFVDVYTRNIAQLKHHPSIWVWVGMNEPGVMEILLEGKLMGMIEESCESKESSQQEHDLFGTNMENCRAMIVHPGPMIFDAILAEDATRPVIKGSFCFGDLDSGDSHNYTGSLLGEDTHYLDYYGVNEKFNSEYGFDALPCEDSLRKVPKVYERLKGVVFDVASNQLYQYKYLKYATEHYRLQKYEPCSGYIQFLFNDTSPVSFYGVYDWWNLPKKGLEAFLESNQPLAVMAKYSRERLDGIYIVNDLLKDFGEVEVIYSLILDEKVCTYHKTVNLGLDSIIQVAELGIYKDNAQQISLYLQLYSDKGKLLASNHYDDIFHCPGHPEGHPRRLSNEYGCRLYNG